MRRRRPARFPGAGGAFLAEADMTDALDPDRLSAAHALYLEGKASVASIATSLGLTTGAFYRLRLRDGWPTRPNPIVARQSTPPAFQQDSASAAWDKPPPPAQAPAGEDDAQLTDRLERALAREVSSFEADADPQAAPAGRNVRILASLVKTLAELRKLEAAPKSKRRKGQMHDGQAQRPPRDLATLREDIAQRLAEFRRSRSTS
jgi:hypothetical protein